jgi:hypothetical protein
MVMKLFCFASKNVENIRRGIERRRWAVSTASDAANRGRITKAKKNFGPGSLGLLYCSEIHAFTVPFISRSHADPNEVVVDIWPEPWILPFSIQPLGDLTKTLKADLAKVLWPMLADSGAGGVTAALNITGATVFVPTEISDHDWQLVLENLTTATEGR